MKREWHLWAVSQGPLIIVVVDCEKLPNKPRDDTLDKSPYFVNYYCKNGWLRVGSIQWTYSKWGQIILEVAIVPLLPIVVVHYEKLPHKPKDETPDKIPYFVNY